MQWSMREICGLAGGTLLPRVLRHIIFRGDSGCYRQRIVNYCERAGVHYIGGLARDTRLEAQVE